jgi:hypothetical protein
MLTGAKRKLAPGGPSESWGPPATPAAAPVRAPGGSAPAAARSAFSAVSLPLGARAAPPAGGSGGGAGAKAGAGKAPTAAAAPAAASRTPVPTLFSWAFVCACNMNRSTSGHAALQNLGYGRASSYGTSDMVRLPGISGPRAFPFGTPYTVILESMIGGNAATAAWMAMHGLTNMLQRNAGLKAAPESWPALSDAAVRDCDFVICFDRVVYRAVLAGAFGFWGVRVVRSLPAGGRARRAGTRRAAVGGAPQRWRPGARAGMAAGLPRRRR